MKPPYIAIPSLLLVVGTALASDDEISWDTGNRPTPIDSRNLSWPGLLLMGFEPAPATTLGKGRMSIRFSYQHVSNYIASDNVLLYLEERDEAIPLDETDVAAIEAFEEEAFFLDGEVGRLNLGLQYGLGSRTDLVVNVPYMSYTGGELDGFIFNFHENFGIGQNGRDLIAADQFQMVLSEPDEGRSYVRLSSPGGGLADPTFRLRHAFPGIGRGWRIGLEGGMKLPLGDPGQLHSSGNLDLGVQLAAERRWARSGLVINGYWVAAGDVDALPGLETEDPLGAQLSLLRDFGELITGHFQVLTARTVFHGISASGIGYPEFQVTLGLSARLAGKRRFTFAYTNNVINHDNTPDTVFHANFAQLFD
jgi:hypothetical protein